MIQNARNSIHAVATIGAGASLSNALDLSDYAIAAIQMPAAWTTAAITFLACATKDGTYLPVYDDAGTEVTVASASAAVNRVIVNKAVLEQLAALRWVKLRSGVAATPVNQVAAAAITVLLKS
jgi:hypothetical protein